MSRHRHRIASIIFLSVLLFFMGFMLTDYGASMRVSGGHGESLIFASIPPRVVYHMGLVLAASSFFITYAVAIGQFIESRDM